MIDHLCLYYKFTAQYDDDKHVENQLALGEVTVKSIFLTLGGLQWCAL